MADTAPDAPRMLSATPILFVQDVTRAAHFYAETLGFEIDFLYGTPPYYGAVARGGACLHLRHVGQPNFTELAAREPSLIVTTIEVSDVAALFDTYKAAGAEIAQPLIRQDWGGTDFHVRDPDGNVIAFVEFGIAA
jgi:uncharacterized glyoxalase superfamily protein PhnB